MDMAGSERTRAPISARQEVSNISRSLVTFKKVCAALDSRDATPRFVPYRDSKLTHFFKQSLGGNNKTILIANILPVTSLFEETCNTLRIAKTCKYIKNKPKSNNTVLLD